MLPVMGVVVIYSRSVAQCTEEQVALRVDHNSRMTLPDDQVAWLRTPHALERLSPTIEVVGTRILIWETGPAVDGVNQMRTITFRARAVAQLLGCRNYGPAVGAR